MRIAPRVDARTPADGPGAYHPPDRPRKPATTEPAIPSSMVTIIPPGSCPGMMTLAMAPTTNPTMIIHNKCIVLPRYAFKDLDGLGSGIGKRLTIYEHLSREEVVTRHKIFREGFPPAAEPDPTVHTKPGDFALDLNRASFGELSRIPMLGPERARALMQARPLV